MGDSDDEYDRNRRRDKFARERRDYQEPGNRSRDDWRDGDRSGGGSGSGWNRSRGRDAYGRDAYGRRDRYGSPGDRSDVSPPVKRMRGREWGDERGSSYSSGYDSYHSHSDHRNSSSTAASGQSRGETVSDNCPTQPAMMLFKQFLHQLDDEVGDTDAVKKYNEYKMDFKKKQVKEFFRKHKDEEWFKIKYHPDEKPKRESEQQEAVQKRLHVFNELVASGWIDSTAVDVENSEKIIKILDAAVIKLEGGTDLDLQILDQPELEEAAVKSEMPLFAPEAAKPAAADSETVAADEQVTAADAIQEENSQSAIPDAGSGDPGEPNIKSEPADETTAEKANGQVDETSNENSLTSSTGQVTEQANGGGETESAEPESLVMAEPEEPSGPRPLHRTASIFLRNLPPNITRTEVLDVCRRFNGFLRLAIAEPNVERRFYRRGWATYKCNVSIKDICWQFNAHKFNQTECGAIINRSLNRRIRSVNGIASHKNVIRTDIRHAAKIVYNLDKQKGLWIEKSASEGHGAPDSGKIRPAFAEESKNPLLQNITDYLIEEANAEEEELLGVEAGELEGDDTEQGQALERDEAMIKILDRMLLYLRIVHSVDYYNNTDYPQEDEMPNRIGIMHARGSPPTSNITIAEINEYIKTFEEKIKPYLETVAPVTEEEKKQLGYMAEDAAVDQFVEENTKCVKAEKYECLLEGKKFKAKDFVTKHLKTKHPVQIEEVKKETAYYNNYISDPKRPQLPEHPSNRPQTQSSPASSFGKEAPAGHPAAPHPMWPGPYHPPAFGYGYGPPRPPMPGYGMAGGMGMGGWGPNRNYPPGGGMPPPMNASGRGVRSYRDLDAPEEW